MPKKVTASFKRVGLLNEYTLTRLTNTTSLIVEGRKIKKGERVKEKVLDKLCEMEEYNVSIT